MRFHLQIQSLPLHRADHGGRIQGEGIPERSHFQGQGNEADFKKMAFLTKELALNKPSKGDLSSWTEKTTALQAASESLVAGKPGALDGFKTAVNCKACHSVHKGD